MATPYGLGKVSVLNFPLESMFLVSSIFYRTKNQEKKRMEYYVSQENGRQNGTGTRENPFRTIGQAAEIARGGDRIIIGKGIYREWVSPCYGGLNEHQRISYIAKSGEKPVISGAEEVTGWEPVEGGLWKKVLDNTFFGEYNPFAHILSGDWYDDLGKPHHTGEVYLDGRAMYEEPSVSALTKSVSAEKGLRWYAQVLEENTEIWCNFGDTDPNSHLVEVNVRPFGFFPNREGVDYIQISGLWIRQVASNWAPPTAFQPGALGTHWSKGWIIENCTISHSKCSGISIGKRKDAFDNAWSADPVKGGAQTYTEAVFSNLKRGWSKDLVGSHIIRNNHIYDCGQTGIVGCMGGAFSTIENNYIHDINIRGEFEGAEIAGMKLHAPIDTIIRGNCFRNCNRGLWLDWQAQGARVTQNIFWENAWQDMFLEMCHGPCVIDNNLFLSKTNLRNTSQGSALVHNLFAGALKVRRDISRFSMYHMEHDTFVKGVMLIYGGDDRVINNIFLGGEESGKEFGTGGYDDCPDMSKGREKQTNDRPLVYADSMLPVEIHHNLYFNGACSYRYEQNTEVGSQKAEWEIIEEAGVYYLKTNLFDCGWGKKADLITSDVLGYAFESAARYENADGSALLVDKDLNGKQREAGGAMIGPFEERFTMLQLTPKR
ncbi:MAG: right-handed parallel beta-helix repeat-containing protein [Lachnospiraceae bacterium]|nr:right-handed parallel beta-helix repeat-containing protein [Lachnospiraceae bacterium]